MSTLYADIAVSVPSMGTLQYGVPEQFASRVEIGMRSFVAVRNRRMVGTIVGLSSEKLFDSVKDLETVLEAAPVLEPAFLELTRRIADTYFCSWGQAIEAALPAPFRKGKFAMKSRVAHATSRAEVLEPDFRVLNADQEAAYARVSAALDAKRPGSFLLHGVTGSGKTEVYLHLIRKLLEQGRGAIVLVPEISLTPQTMDRFHSRFGGVLAVIHSRLSQARRVEEWHRIRSGEARVVIGARSAVFSPVRNLGLIVIDEEHDTSYKQEETPRYHAREVAGMRAAIENAIVLMGTATPSLESFHAAHTGALEKLVLAERIEKRPLPAVDIVDMRIQPEKNKLPIFSRPLEDAVHASLAKKEQVMLLLNRRGFSTYLHCSSCGYVATCPDCRIALAYHFDKTICLCHACGKRQEPQKLCPSCQKHQLHYFGIGTQKVTLEAERLFPEARIARMDADSTARKDGHETILRAFRKKEIDVLVGTQMIAKGHDFANVSLIGVISADTALHVPDFRAAERTFDLLTQVAGRTGRGDVPGRVIVQTEVPHHYAIQAAKNHDFEGFYEKEMVFRRELHYPPVTRLVKVIAHGPDERIVVKQMLTFSRWVEALLGQSGVTLAGPAPALLSKTEGEFFWNLFLKSPTVEAATALLKKAFEGFRKGGVQFAVDVDPHA